MNKIWNVRESRITWIPGFDVDTLPNGLESQIQVVHKRGEIGLQVGGIVGSIPLTNGDTLQISPKVGGMNFFRMLLTAEGLFGKLEAEFKDFVGYERNDDSSLPELVAKSYFLELGVVQANSPRFDRVKKQKQEQFATGRILPLPTLTRLRLGSETPIVSECLIRNYDTAENRLLAAAAVAAHKLLKPADISADVSRIMQFWRRYYRGNILTNDISEVNANLSRGRYYGSRGYYIKALTMAKMVLGHEGFTQGVATEVLGDAVVVNTATLFEQYLRALIATRYGKDGIVVQKGGNPVRSLYQDGSFELKPDITLSRGTKFLSIGDAKYKEPDAGDHYQMSVYMSAYQVDTGFLLCPDFDSDKVETICRTNAGEKQVYEIRLPLKELNTTEMALSTLHQTIPFLQ